MPRKLPDESHADFWHWILCDFMLDVKLALRQEIKILDSISHPNIFWPHQQSTRCICNYLPLYLGVCIYGLKMLYLDTQIKTFKKEQLVSDLHLQLCHELPWEQKMILSLLLTLKLLFLSGLHLFTPILTILNTSASSCTLYPFFHPAYSARGHGFKLWAPIWHK